MGIPISYGLRSLIVRRFSTLSAAVGIGLVVAVFILVLGLASGFRYALRTAGSPANAMVLRKGSNAEIASALTQEQADSLSVRPEILSKDGGRPLVVREMVVLVVMNRRRDDAPAQVMVRGTQEWAPELRGVRILEGGRMFRAGVPEVVVGRSLAERLKGVSLGGTFEMRRQPFRVVGIFETGGSGFESEIWGDAAVLQSLFGREGFLQSVTFRMREPGGFALLKGDIEKDPRYEVEVKTEAQYYAEQSGTLGMVIEILGGLITVIMSIGAVFGAMNTMYAAVGSRTREIATLRALGFSRGSILASFLVEALILGCLGGIIGGVAALPINGLTTSTTNWDTFSELAFAFRVTPGILASGFTFAVTMGAIGGLFPALRAARLPITAGLRQV